MQFLVSRLTAETSDTAGDDWFPTSFFAFFPTRPPYAFPFEESKASEKELIPDAHELEAAECDLSISN